ncbi:hypothetical protein PVAND_001445 [Polypedilum vanderplanki]|uniref:Glycoside hydrolase n=1 Tax=Polypedilum vanderplanki TaxID=319348 RepID=A0A9J6BMZ2_POLVA|nr:hypothetical protein PVAND_001445 [Polypedilum vanderplanki]
MKTLIFITILIVTVSSEIKRYSFPDDFLFGAATASYQIEGAWNVDGKIPSIWDTASHRNPSSVVDGTTGDDAGMSYYYYEKDIQALKDIGFKVYRFSIAWTRMLTKTNQVNQKGIDYYNKLIDRLKEEGIEPMVTIYHWDLPQYLQDLGGWTNPRIVKYFEIFADLAFKSFGDRVKEWITFNEPSVFCDEGYGWASHAPEIRTDKNIGNYLCTHHVLLAHASAYRMYKEKYFPSQQGKVGICLNSGFNYPYNSTVTQETVDKAVNFYLGRFANAIFTEEGDYPKIMRDAINEKSKNEGRRWSRLPHFTTAQIESLKGSADFLAINYYSSNFVVPFDLLPGWDPAGSDNEIWGFHDPTIWKRAKSVWLYQVPDGLRDLLIWIKDHYNNPLVYITENGWSDEPMTIDDYDRIEYLNLHLKALSQAIDASCNVKAYTVWSLIDNFEWMRGYTERFGIYAINFTDPERQRIPKKSVALFKDLMQNMYVEIDEN